MVKSLGGAVRAGLKGALLAESANRAATFTPGWWAMLTAAVAVSVGWLPVAVPSAEAFANKAEHVVEIDPGGAPVEPTQAARMLARESISPWGTVPFPASVLISAAPEVISLRFAALA